MKSRQGLALTEEEGVTQSDWSHVIISYDGSGKVKAPKFYLNGLRSVPTEIIRDKISCCFNFKKGELQNRQQRLGGRR